MPTLIGVDIESPGVLKMVRLSRGGGDGAVALAVDPEGSTALGGQEVTSVPVLGWPAAAQQVAWLSRPGELMQHAHARHGDVFGLRLGGRRPAVIVSSPAALSELFAAGPDDFTGGSANGLFKPLMGDASVFLRDGEAHLQARRLLLPMLHGERLAEMETTIAATAEQVLSERVRDRELAFTRMDGVLDQSALDVMIRAVLGVADDEEAALLRSTLGRLRQAPNRWLFLRLGLSGPSGWLSPSRHRRYVEPARCAITDLVRRRAEDGGENRPDAIGMLLSTRVQGGGTLALEEIVDHLMTLVVAGHETTAAGMSWAVMHLATHPAALGPARAEARDGGSRWLDACLAESLRLNPPIAVVGRRAVRDLTLDRHAIPGGTLVLASSWLAHRRAEVWKKPDRYQPERFLDRRYPTSEYLPFGGGDRRCVGTAFVRVQARATLRAILRRWTPWGDRVEPSRRMTVTFVPARGARVQLQEAQ
jgi:cytochrome P450